MYVLLYRGMYFVLHCLNPVSVHTWSVARLYLVFVRYQVPRVLGAHDECYINYVYRYISSPYINPNMSSTPVPE